MDWTRGRTIGRGSSATVSVANSLRSGDIFAAAKSVELSQSQFLQREQKILSTLSSPHVVGYIGYNITRESNKLFYNLLMEYVPGGTLSRGRLDEAAIGTYTRQIVMGIEYLHSSGIAHCDIKGQNILIGESGAKIADFGCAKWLNPAETAVPVSGTPMFMSPEVARGEEQGFPADIWALGCTVIEMASGGPPWANVTDPLSVLYRIAFSGGLPEFPDFLSSQAKDFLSKCLRRDPKERWTAKQLLEHPFLAESNSPGKQNPDFNSNSPTSILDQGVWNSIEGSESQTRRSDSMKKRMRALSSSSLVPSWTWDEDWITIRRNRDEDSSVCGSGTTTNCHDWELEDYVNGEELVDLVDYRDRGVPPRNNSSSNILMACVCTEHRVVNRSPNFERDEEEDLLLIQCQFL